MDDQEKQAPETSDVRHTIRIEEEGEIPFTAGDLVRAGEDRGWYRGYVSAFRDVVMILFLAGALALAANELLRRD